MVGHHQDAVRLPFQGRQDGPQDLLVDQLDGLHLGGRVALDRDLRRHAAHGEGAAAVAQEKAVAVVEAGGFLVGLPQPGVIRAEKTGQDAVKRQWKAGRRSEHEQACLPFGPDHRLLDPDFVGAGAGEVACVVHRLHSGGRAQDVEILFLLPFAVAFTALPAGALVGMLVFILLLAEGLVWAWRRGYLEWS